MAKRFPWGVALGAGATVLTGIGLIVRLREQEAHGPIGRVALIGDSYAVGLGPPLSLLLPEFQFEGHVGTNTSQWAHHRGCGQCGDWLPKYRPRIVLVSLGTNDGEAPKPANYQAIVQMIHGLGAQVVWLEPPRGVRTPSRAVIASLGVRTIRAPDTPLGADRLHPASYEPWARQIAAALAT